MAAKRTTKSSRSKQVTAQRPAWVRLALALTLVPMLIGLVLIVARALDIYLWDNTPEDQVVLGILFILAGFAIANALQKRWLLAAGWFLLLVADWVVLTSLNLVTQGVALFLGIAGLALLAFEFYRNWQKNNQGGPRKKV